jgi:ketosteroid isomerase-like protein
MTSTVADDQGVRKAIEALLAGNRADLCGGLLHADVRWREPGRSLVAGEYRGCDEVIAGLFGRLRELSGGTLTLVAWDTLAIDGANYVAVYVVAARRRGRDLLSRDVCVVQVRDGSIVSGQAFHANQQAWDRFWS